MPHGHTTKSTVNYSSKRALARQFQRHIGAGERSLLNLQALLDELIIGEFLL